MKEDLKSRENMAYLKKQKHLVLLEDYMNKGKGDCRKVKNEGQLQDKERKKDLRAGCMGIFVS